MGELIDWQDEHGWPGPGPGEKHLRYWQRRLKGIMSYVYAIQGWPGTPVKFGVAADVRKRMAGLQTGNWQPLRLLFVVPGDRELESELHARMIRADPASRAHGEWFFGDPVTATLALMVALSDRMKAAHQDSATVPHFTNFAPFDRERLGPIRDLEGDPGQVVTDPEAVARYRRYFSPEFLEASRKKNAERTRRYPSPAESAGLDAFLKFHGSAPELNRGRG
jgi:hypothetical protein